MPHLTWVVLLLMASSNGKWEQHAHTGVTGVHYCFPTRLWQSTLQSLYCCQKVHGRKRTSRCSYHCFGNDGCKLHSCSEWMLWCASTQRTSGIMQIRGIKVCTFGFWCAYHPHFQQPIISAASKTTIPIVVDDVSERAADSWEELNWCLQ